MELSDIITMFEAGMSPAAIADEAGASVQTIRRVLKGAGKDTSLKGRTKQLDDEAIAQAYIDGTTVPDILKTHSITYGVLYRILQQRNVPIRKAAEAKVNNIRLDKAVEMYIAGSPLWAIRQETGIAQPTLHGALHERNIQLRRPRLA